MTEKTTQPDHRSAGSGWPCGGLEGESRQRTEDLGRLIGELHAEITRRKQTEGELRRANNDWEVTFNAITDPVSIHDKDFRIIRVNKAFAAGFGMKPGEVVGKRCYEIIHGTEEPWPDCPHQHTLACGKPTTEEFPEAHLGRYLQVSASPIFDDRNDVVGSVHIVKDITERKGAEEALQRARDELEERVQARTAELVEANEQLVAANAQLEKESERREQAEQTLRERLRFETLLADLSARFVNLPVEQVEGEIQDAQRRICASLDLDRSTLWQLSRESSGAYFLTHLYQPPGAPPVPERLDANISFPWAIQKILADEILTISKLADLPPEAARDQEVWRYYGTKSTVVFPLRAGEEIFAALSFATMREERDWPEALVKRLQLVAQIFANALARKRAEEALRASETQLRLVADSLPVLIAYVDQEQRYRFNNLVYATWFGIPRDVLIGVPVREVLGDTAYVAVRGYMEKALAGEGVQFETELTTRDGLSRYVQALYVPHVDERGSVLGFYALVHDITEHRRVDLEIQRQREQLAHVARVSTLGELTASLAHEIHQPLAAIMSNAQAALRFLAQDEPDFQEVREILQDIVADDRRANEVIQRLRLLLRRARPELAPLAINELIGDVLALLKREVFLRGIMIEVHLDADLPPVVGDRVQLQQVLLNLALNAADAMAKSEPESRRLIIRTAREDEGKVRVAVRDFGAGLDGQNPERLFEPFYSTKPEGLGMGLAICRSIVEAHGGRLWAASNSNRGATFMFTLRVSEGGEA
jgi:two-component system sensor kinase FixL